MNIFPKLAVVILIFVSSLSFAQDEMEVFVLDSYVTPDKPYILNISFFTSDSAMSEIIINGKYTYTVSEILALDHDFKKEIKGMKFDTTFVPFVIKVKDKNGNEFTSEEYGFDLPQVNLIQNEDSPGMFSVCLGGIIYLIPSAGIVFEDNNKYLTIAKEMPLFSILQIGKNYPVGVVSLEYAHIFEAKTRNFLRLGYKHFFEPPAIEFASLGLNLQTDFLGYNSFSPEATLGLFSVKDAFTFYTRYRYNFQPGSDRKFHEISVGLFSYFFSYNL